MSISLYSAILRNSKLDADIAVFVNIDMVYQLNPAVFSYERSILFTLFIRSYRSYSKFVVTLRC